MKLVLTAAIFLNLCTTTILTASETVETTKFANSDVKVLSVPQYLIFSDGVRVDTRNLTVTDYTPVQGKTSPLFSGSDSISSQPEVGSSQVMIFEVLNFKTRQ